MTASELKIPDTQEGVVTLLKQYWIIIETTPNALIMCDVDGKVVLVNSAAERMFGYTRAELLHQPIEILVPERFRSDHVHHRKGYMNEPLFRQMGVGRDLAGRRKDGTEFPVEVGLNSVTTPDGQFVVSAIVDISDRKEDELRIRRSNQELEQFAYVASHDLQEPLRMVGSFAELLRKEYAGSFDERGERWLSFLVDGAVRMRTLVTDLLAFSRAANSELKVESVNTQRLLEKILHDLKIAIEESGASIVLDTLPTVLTDQLQLRLVLQNLISNAIKFRHPSIPPKITVSATQVPNGWRFSVADNGIGINPDYFDKIFVIFQRLHGQADFKGTGIGLAICRKIVERLGGKIEVISQEGSGSTFSFTLPKGGK